MLVDKYIVLKVNKRWRPIGVETVRDAFKNLAKGTHAALHVEYFENEDGEPDYSQVLTMQFVDFPTWLDLQGRQCDRWVKTGENVRIGNNRVRVPSVVQTLNYEKELIKEPVFNLETLWLRDDGVCQWSGKPLASKADASVDHLVPVSKGGPTSWTNCVLCSKDINNKKGDMDPKTFAKKYGYKIPRPQIPSPVVVATSIRNKYNIPDWNFFIS